MTAAAVQGEDVSERESELRWSQHLREHDQRFGDVERTREMHAVAHAREHTFATTALDKAEAQAKEWRAASNEWRDAMKDRENTFARAADLNTLITRINELVELNNRRLGDMDKANVARDERERLRLIAEAEDKRQDERRQSRQQWTVGIAITIVSITVGVLLKLIPS